LLLFDTWDKQKKLINATQLKLNKMSLEVLLGGSLSSDLKNTFAANVSFSGIWAAPQVLPVKFVKLGNVVTMAVAPISATATTASYIQSATFALPASMRPSAAYSFGEAGDLYFSHPIFDNGVSATGQVDFSFESFPNCLFIMTSAAGGNYAGSGGSGFAPLAFSYITDS